MDSKNEEAAAKYYRWVINVDVPVPDGPHGGEAWEILNTYMTLCGIMEAAEATNVAHTWEWSTTEEVLSSGGGDAYLNLEDYDRMRLVVRLASLIQREMPLAARGAVWGILRGLLNDRELKERLFSVASDNTTLPTSHTLRDEKIEKE